MAIRMQGRMNTTIKDGLTKLSKFLKFDNNLSTSIVD